MFEPFAGDFGIPSFFFFIEGIERVPSFENDNPQSLFTLP